MAMLFLVALSAFGLGLFTIRRLRRSLIEEGGSLAPSPFPAEGLPVHAYHAVIQQLKQQKHELAAQQLSERRKAKASDTLSSAILTNLTCGVVFLDSNRLVRQANGAARRLLDFASPAGLHVSDLFQAARLRPEGLAAPASIQLTVEQAVEAALAGRAVVRGLMLNCFLRDGGSQILELTATPVLADDATHMGTTLLISDRTDIERIRHDQRVQREMSSELALELRDSLGKIRDCARQLAGNRDAALGDHLAEKIAREAAGLERTIGGFVGEEARTAMSNS
jgi:nitrogen fixation/metabolism regulation signal transduction histidine kinase